MEMVFQLKWYWSTGVWPRGAQVRQRCGRWLSPLSSMKTIVRPSFLAFFYLRPALLLPHTNLLFVPLQGPSGGPLAAPSQLPQNPPRMAGVVADPAFFLDQMGDPRRRPQAALVAQRLRPSLEAAFDSPQIFLAQSRFPSRSSGPLQPPQSAFLQLLRPATDGLSMSTDAATNFRLVYALPQQFGRLTAALFQPYEVPANSCWISHAETVAQKIRNVTILCDNRSGDWRRREARHAGQGPRRND